MSCVASGWLGNKLRSRSPPGAKTSSVARAVFERTHRREADLFEAPVEIELIGERIGDRPDLERRGQVTPLVGVAELPGVVRGARFAPRASRSPERVADRALVDAEDVVLAADAELRVGARPRGALDVAVIALGGLRLDAEVVAAVADDVEDVVLLRVGFAEAGSRAMRPAKWKPLDTYSLGADALRARTTLVTLKLPLTSLTRPGP